MTRFQDKTALITGGALGIGFATAQRLAQEGARVCIMDWVENDLRGAGKRLKSAGIEHLCSLGDVSVPGDCEAAVRKVLEAWGRLDVLVANAGVRRSGSVLEATEDDWEYVLGVNLRGVANSARAAARAMIEGGRGGAMVFVSSNRAIIGRAGMPIYDAAKAGVLSLARSMAADLAQYGIRVNCISPGFTVTDYHIRNATARGGSADQIRAQSKPGLLKRPAEPAEMAAAIAFLASEDASYITATNLMVDGGQHAVPE